MLKGQLGASTEGGRQLASGALVPQPMSLTSGRPSAGSGLGSSMRWIMSSLPIHSHAPRYGSLSFGRSGLIDRPAAARVEVVGDAHMKAAHVRACMGIE